MSRRPGATRKAVLSCFREQRKLTDALLAWYMRRVGISRDAAVAARRQLVLLGCVRLCRWIVREQPAIAARRRRLLPPDPQPLTPVSQRR